MKYCKRLAALVLACAFLWINTAAVGGADDPVISRSYLESVFSGEFLKDVSNQTGSALNLLEADVLRQAAEELAESRGEQAFARPQNLGGSGTLYTAKQDVVIFELGSKLTPVEGNMVSRGDGLIDITQGMTITRGTTLLEGHTYFCTDDLSGYVTTTEVGCCNYRGSGQRAHGTETDYASRADALSALGLFYGTEKGYSLSRTATRIEALVMFLRILGLEEEALECTAPNPFHDVPGWASQYAAYAYQMGLAQGTGNGLYSATRQVSARDYMTFLLRALGYRDEIDFSWNQAVEDALTLGMLTDGEYREFSQKTFTRAQMVYASWQALLSSKTDQQLLICALRDDGVITREQLAESVCMVVGSRIH